MHNEPAGEQHRLRLRCVQGDRFRQHVVRRLKELVKDPETGAPLFKTRAVTTRAVLCGPDRHPAFAAFQRYGQRATPQVRYPYLAGTFDERLRLRLVAKYERQRPRLTFVPDTLGGITTDDAQTVRLLEGLADEEQSLFVRPPRELRQIETDGDDDCWLRGLPGAARRGRARHPETHTLRLTTDHRRMIMIKAPAVSRVRGRRSTVPADRLQECARQDHVAGQARVDAVGRE